GQPLAGAELQILGPEGLTRGAGVEGEIVVKGPTVIRGYHNRPDVNVEAFRDGWFFTGDIGVLDDEGFLYVLDRRRDLIVSGGENIYPTEVESVLMLHEGILEAAVVGEVDETFGQVPVAHVVVQTPGVLTPEDLRRHCREHLAGYKVPKRFIYVSSLPKTASGKLLRRALREGDER
ncbi:MAG: AMP-binding protein, partial [Firmicutes bacterium]|nr:AMP-binding protein [Bacillota bacterium]